MGKIATNLAHLRELLTLYYGVEVYGIHTPVPWGLAVSGFGASLTQVASLLVLLVLSRDKDPNADAGPIYYTGGENASYFIQTQSVTDFPIEKVDFPPFPICEKLPPKS